MDPYVILVTLVHNRKKLVGSALHTAINQSLDKDKWIHLVIDNASTDGADTIVKSICDSNNNMFFKKMDKNIGQQRAYNFVLNDWIPNNFPKLKVFCVLDSDDELVLDALQKTYDFFKANPSVGQTYSGFNIIDGAGRIKVKNHPKAKMVKNQFSEEGQKMLRRIFLSQNPIGHMRSFRIKCLMDIGGFNTKYQYATDYNIAGRMLMKHPVVKINSVLYRWRQHGDQVEGKHSPQQTKDWRDMQIEFRNLYKKYRLI